MPDAIQPAEHHEAPMLAEHPVLDFLNTVVRVDGELVDSLQSDSDVLRWLARAGWPMDEAAVNLRPTLLLEVARALRAAIQGAVEQQKAGTPNVSILNSFLYDAQSRLKIVTDKGGGLRLERQWSQHTPEQVLAPLMESTAELLVTSDFSLIKRCEDAECVLWFYDRTRSHHRRWCSMARCGTRNKVAAFRKRQGGS
ncbi:MAG: ABATE domain-containing protein [Edaphobacter sp.]